MVPRHHVEKESSEDRSYKKGLGQRPVTAGVGTPEHYPGHPPASVRDTNPLTHRDFLHGKKGKVESSSSGSRAVDRGTFDDVCAVWRRGAGRVTPRGSSSPDRRRHRCGTGRRLRVKTEGATRMEGRARVHRQLTRGREGGKEGRKEGEGTDTYRKDLTLSPGPGVHTKDRRARLVSVYGRHADRSVFASWVGASPRSPLDTRGNIDVRAHSREKNGK